MKPFRIVCVGVVLVSTLSFHAPPDGGWGEARKSLAREGEEIRFVEPRPWPVGIPVHLSSSFGEFRDGHLHAGVDIRSFGREGIACRAVGSGHVARLRASPFGYGKAVYLSLETGETAVYAHLSEFAPAIDSVVWAAQVAGDRYQVDIQPEPGRLHIRKGDIIGYSGRTGAAAPHLHFEVRDATENPVNPLDVGWQLEDAVPPTILRLECLPLGPDSRVDGRCAPAFVELRRVEASAFAAAETLAVSGRIGFAVQVIDRLDGYSGRLAPYRVELEVDGERLSLIEMRRFAYEHTREVELAYDMGRARTRGQQYLLLFHREGETLWHREFTRGGVVETGSLAARPGSNGVHTAVVRAMDRAGRSADATLRFVVSEFPAKPGAKASLGDTRLRRFEGRGEFPGCYFFEDVMSIQGFASAQSEPPELTGAGMNSANASQEGSGELILSFDGVGEAGRTLPVRVGEGTSNVHVMAARSDARLVRDIDEVRAGLTVGPGALYSKTLIYLASWEKEVAGTLPAGSGLSALSGGVRFGPMSAALRKSVEVRFPLEDPPAGNEAVFRFDERGGLWSIRPSTARGDTVCALVREPGVYAVLVDSLAPAIGTPSVAARKSYATGSLVPEVVVSILDRGSGVDADRTEVYLDGKKQVARWDGFSEKTIVLLGDKNIIGEHDLTIVAVDRLGNSSGLVTQIHFPPPATRSGEGGSR